VKCISLLHSIITDLEGYCCPHSPLSQHDSLSQTPTRATRKQRTKKLGRCTSQRVLLHAHSLHAATQDSPTYMRVFVRSSEWAGNACARWSLARRTALLRKRNIMNVTLSSRNAELSVDVLKGSTLDLTPTPPQPPIDL